MAEEASFAQAAYDAIKGDIVSQTLKPGAFISEAEYAEKLGISRTPVREALKTLEKEGLLDIYPRKGAQIKSLTLDDILQIHEATEAIEQIVISQIASRFAEGAIDQDALTPLRTLLRQMDTHMESGNMSKWMQCDQVFHNQLINLCGNKHLVQFAHDIRNRMNMTLWFITPKFADRTVSTQDHKAILDAIAAGDAAAAGNAIAMHIGRVRRNFVSAMGS